ncbi:hypothetical protein KZ829_03035 [Actinoplanes hulinensis]|uniref:Uncharacterized protein n=1 Tax=Actinoplanes hulinensis TaxID=1144547 RepID=A0ABS7AX08_9ACTN|nr:hypothetical protein [Actinoplanes hulinensis]MBW6432714.1 hypothetical protein [Actinoplanes hulinensis]
MSTPPIPSTDQGRALLADPGATADAVAEALHYPEVHVFELPTRPVAPGLISGSEARP